MTNNDAQNTGQIKYIPLAEIHPRLHNSAFLALVELEQRENATPQELWGAGPCEQRAEGQTCTLSRNPAHTIHGAPVGKPLVAWVYL